MRVYNSIQSNDEQLNNEELKKKVKSEFSGNLSQQLTNQFIALGLYTYKSVTDEDLNEYIQIWESDLGTYYIELLFDGYKNLFKKMSLDLTHGIE